MFIMTTALHKLLSLTKRIRAVAGGTGASKTIGIIQIFIDKAQSDKVPKKASIVSESFPHLERGAIADFKNIMMQHGYWKDNLWNETKHFYTFETGSIIEFFSADEWDKVKGPRRDRLFINEVNRISFETFEQLEVRTNEEIWMDWNPDSEFWFYTEILNSESYAGVVDFITLTYLDNEGLPQTVRDSIERRRGRADWWRVYGLGELGEIIGKIYNNWKIIDEVPRGARLERYGLDYGYTNDPTAIAAVYYHNGGYILDEIAFNYGLSNKTISEIILQNGGNVITVPDSAEPKSNDELKDYGVNVVPADKGKDSVCNGIQLVQAQDISITKRSVNGIKAYRNYLWQVDKNGKALNVPEHAFSHWMDAVRYAFSNLLGDQRQQEGVSYQQSGGIHAYFPKLGF